MSAVSDFCRSLLARSFEPWRLPGDLEPLSPDLNMSELICRIGFLIERFPPLLFFWEGNCPPFTAADEFRGTCQSATIVFYTEPQEDRVYAVLPPVGGARGGAAEGAPVTSPSSNCRLSGF